MMKFVQTPRRVSRSDWADVTSSGWVELHLLGRAPVTKRNEKREKGKNRGG